jgi:uncharacterized Zn finger protein (UPF0148 family)
MPNTCPVCGTVLVQEEKRFICPECGYTIISERGRNEQEDVCLRPEG